MGKAFLMLCTPVGAFLVAGLVLFPVIALTFTFDYDETCVTTPNVITYTKCNTNHKCNKKSTPNVIPTTNVIKKLHQMYYQP